MTKKNLEPTDALDFHYLLTLMPPLHNIEEFAWLPELFSIIGADSFINLCKYCGGETIRVPTVEELSKSVCSLQWFYDVYIKKCKSVTDVPRMYRKMVAKIIEVYNAELNNTEAE